MTIKVIYENEPILEIKENMSAGKMVPFGLHRDRMPDAGWDEFRWSNMEGSVKIKEVELTEELKKILIEDICSYYRGTECYNKLKEFDLIK